MKSVFLEAKYKETHDRKLFYKMICSLIRDCQSWLHNAWAKLMNYSLKGKETLTHNYN